mgnify:CR=1 FL=1
MQHRKKHRERSIIEVNTLTKTGGALCFKKIEPKRKENLNT